MIIRPWAKRISFYEQNKKNTHIHFGNTLIRSKHQNRGTLTQTKLGTSLRRCM